MSQRDAGWIQIYARNNQEIIDTAIQAYRISEQVYVPVMVCYDGYILSHTVMPVVVPSQADVDKFLPAYVPHTILSTDNPKNLNQVTLADPRADASGTLCHGYMELRYLLAEAIQQAPATIRRVDAEYGEAFGRSWGGMTWGYRDEDADVLLTAAGSLASEASVAVDALRSEGVKAGVRAVRVYRPFPAKELAEAVCRAKLVIVFDKSLSYGYQGPICADLKAALYAEQKRPAVHGYVAGLGGRDVKARELVEAVKQSIADCARGAIDKETTWINCQI
jgi:pyruvate/2-oxoacid:ferredoxin oxidoreductase alpha subunit